MEVVYVTLLDEEDPWLEPSEDGRFPRLMR